MRAMALAEFGGPDRLRMMDLPRPRPGRGEVLVRVVAAGVNAEDRELREGRLAATWPHRFPLVPGFDVAGVVEELGEAATGFRKGDRVWAFSKKPTLQWGTWADHAAVDEAHLGLMPAKLLFEEAASVPMAGLAAWQALERVAGLGRGSAILIGGAASGPGHFAVQLARNAGAHVVALAAAAHHAFVLSLGADAAVDPTREETLAAVRRHCPDGLDLAIDAGAGEAAAVAGPLLRAGGRLVVLDPLGGAAAGGERLAVEPHAGNLRDLARQLDQKRLRTHVEKIYPLGEAARAQEALAAGDVRGKLVLNL